VADIEMIPAELGRPETVLADNGYANGDEVAVLAESDIKALVATAAEGRRRRHDFRPAKAEAPEIARPIDPSQPILAVSPNLDRTTDRRHRIHLTPKSKPQVQQTAS
jgi:hypothetical protein